MVTLHEGKHFIINNETIVPEQEAAGFSSEEGKNRLLLTRCWKTIITGTVWSIWK